MKTKKFKGYIVSDVTPKPDDLMVCVNRKSQFYGQTSKVTYKEVLKKTIDTKNWKVIENVEEHKIGIVDDVIESLKEQILKYGDYTVLDELLHMIPVKNLIQSMEEKTWGNYSKIKRK